METKPNELLTREDLVTVSPRMFPKGSFRGEIYDAKGDNLGNLYVHAGRAYVGEPRPHGRGEVIRMLPGSFDPRTDFQRAGGMQLSQSQRVSFWKFKPSQPTQIASELVKVAKLLTGYGAIQKPPPNIHWANADIGVREVEGKFGPVAKVAFFINDTNKVQSYAMADINGAEASEHDDWGFYDKLNPSEVEKYANDWFKRFGLEKTVKKGWQSPSGKHVSDFKACMKEYGIGPRTASELLKVAKLLAGANVDALYSNTSGWSMADSSRSTGLQVEITKDADNKGVTMDATHVDWEKVHITGNYRDDNVTEDFHIAYDGDPSGFPQFIADIQKTIMHFAAKYDTKYDPRDHNWNGHGKKNALLSTIMKLVFGLSELPQKKEVVLDPVRIQ